MQLKEAECPIDTGNPKSSAPTSNLVDRGTREVAAAIRVHLMSELVSAKRQPSPRELVAELDRAIGVVARWDLVSVLRSLSEDRVVTGGIRQYLRYVLHSDELTRALRGESAPDKETASTIDAVLRDSGVYKSSAAYQEMVDFVSRFPEHAPFNLMLIRVQNPSCSLFATASQWRRRFRRRGRKMRAR